MNKSEQVDDNFEFQSSLELKDVVWHRINHENADIRGVVLKDNAFIRMDEEIAGSISEGVSVLNRNTSGGRIYFETDASYIALNAKTRYARFSHMSSIGSNGFDMYVDEGDGFFHFNVFVPEVDRDDYVDHLVELETDRHYKHFYKKMIRKVMIYLPLYGTCEDLHIGIPEGSIIRKYEPYNQPPIVYYGSSITQGGCASRAGNNYPAVVSRITGRDFYCLGFSGSAHGEEKMAEYIAGLSMSCLVMEYHHNDIKFPELLRERHFKFYDIIRKKNPDLPVIIMSAPYSDCGKEMNLNSLPAVIESFNKAKERGDNVYFIDGTKVFDGEYYDCATVDGCHPNDYGFMRMAEAVLEKLEEIKL